MKEGINLNVGAQTSLKLSRAILLYEGLEGGRDDNFAPRKPVAFASVHGISWTTELGEAVIGPGQVLRVEELAELIRGLQNAPTARRIQSERVLYSDAGMLMFWVPETRRPIFFRAYEQKNKPRKINTISGTTVSHPPLLIVATPGHLYLFALAQNERPTASTELYRAPYYNLYESGLMCRGNVALPETMDPSEEALKRWEDAFFLTNFTHSNYGNKNVVTYRGGHDALWTSLAKSARSFPTRSLIAIDRTVGKVLADGVKGSR